MNAFLFPLVLLRAARAQSEQLVQTAHASDGNRLVRVVIGWNTSFSSTAVTTALAPARA